MNLGPIVLDRNLTVVKSLGLELEIQFTVISGILRLEVIHLTGGELQVLMVHGVSNGQRAGLV